ncbi:MAG: hypothetical protein HRU12_22105 [Phaeodactylibacter sp.]|nr:hypothetical protein [Phaeodactylibacter sp.]
MAAPGYEPTFVDTLLDPTNLWVLFSFVIFIGILVKFGKNAFISLLDNQIEEIRTEIQNAENLRVEAQSLLAQYQRKHTDAVQDAEQIIATAKKQAQEIRAKAEADLDESMERREEQLRERLARMEDAAKEEIRQYAASLAISATSEIISEKLDTKTSEKLVSESIDHVSKNLH